MILAFDRALAAAYASPSQQVRAMSEGWFAEHGYCLGCDARALERLPNNTRASDFRCRRCGEIYELKATKAAIRTRTAGGAHAALAERVRMRQAPSLVLLRYRVPRFEVADLTVIPRHFLTVAVLERRPPLGPNARRAGWVGCVIRLDRLPDAGRLEIVRDGVVRPQAECRASWRRMLFVRASGDSQPWMVAVMQRVDRLGPAFTLAEMYAFEPELQALFPSNANVRPKIRQQLQLLRDAGYLTFLGGGCYARSLVP